VITVTGAAKWVHTENTNVKLPFNLVGAYFTGLSPETVLKIDLVYIVETFPSKDSLLRRLALPSPSFDPKAFKIYGEVVSRMPIGVPVKDNFVGALIAGVSGILSAVAPDIAKSIQTGVSNEERNKRMNHLKGLHGEEFVKDMMRQGHRFDDIWEKYSGFSETSAGQKTTVTETTTYLSPVAKKALAKGGPKKPKEEKKVVKTVTVSPEQVKDMIPKWGGMPKLPPTPNHPSKKKKSDFEIAEEKGKKDTGSQWIK
jgi:hypothetical protein